MDNKSPTKDKEYSKDVVSLQSGENLTALSRTFSRQKELELENKIQKLEKSSKSYIMLLVGLVISIMFKGMDVNSNQKYIQSILHGEASDLATVELFTNLMSAAVPVFGYLLDNFYPFRVRTGPYVVFASLVASLSMILVWAFPLSMRSFTAVNTLYACACTFNAVITQGLLVLKTKMDVQIFDLKKEQESLKNEAQRQRRVSHIDGSAPEMVVERDRIGIKLYITYGILSGIFKGIFTGLSGVIVDNLPIKMVYLVLAAPGILMAAFVLLFIKEPKEKKLFSKSQDLLLTLKSFLKVFLSPLILLPAILKLITEMIPDVQEAIMFILINEGGWNYSQLGGAAALAMLCVFIAVLQLRRLTKFIRFELLFLIGTLSTAYSRLIEVPQIFSSIPTYAFMTSYTLQALLNSAAELFTTIPLFGRFNTLIPDGFESTGANIMKSLIEVGKTVSVYGTKKELDYFGVVNGYYSRVKAPMIVNLAISVITCFVCPFFLIGGMKKQK